LFTFKWPRYHSFTCWRWLFKRRTKCSYGCRFWCQYCRIWCHGFWIELPNYWRRGWKVPSIRILESSCQSIKGWRPAPHTNTIRTDRHAAGWTLLGFIWHTTWPSPIRYRCSPFGFLKYTRCSTTKKKKKMQTETKIHWSIFPSKVARQSGLKHQVHQ